MELSNLFPLNLALNACMLVSTIMPVIEAHAVTYYVATTGLDSNPGTEAAPWKTIKRAVDAMVAGDTTFVKAGTYREGTVTFRRSGSSTQPIQLRAYPGARPKVHFINGILEGGFDRFTISNAAGSLVPIGWITIEGFEIENGREGIKVYTGKDITIRQNWFHDNGHGVLGNGTRVFFDRNIFNHNGQFARCAIDSRICDKDHGLYFNGSSVNVINNLFYDNMGHGIQLNGRARYNSVKHAGREYIWSHDWVIAHNTFAYQAYGVGIVLWGGNCDNVHIENNIFYENRVNGRSSLVQGVYFTTGGFTSRGVIVRNNYAYATSPGATVFLGGGGIEGVNYTLSNNIINDSNPGFVNAPATLPASPNFALTFKSPAIDAGLPLSEIKTAFDGTPRPQGRGYDIGAYEYTD